MTVHFPGLEFAASHENRNESAAGLFLVEDDGRAELTLEWLSRAEVERYGRYRSLQKRRQFLFARYVGRVLLGHLLRVAPSDIGWNAQGTPVVTICGLDPGISVSLSHSESWVAFAVAPASRRIGVDIECRTTPLNVSALASMALTATEQAHLNSASENMRAEVLRQVWTIKESVLKSLGVDNLPSLTSIQVNLEDWKGKSGSQWEVSLVDPMARGRFFGKFTTGIFDDHGLNMDGPSPDHLGNRQEKTAKICGTLAIFMEIGRDVGLYSTQCPLCVEFEERTDLFDCNGGLPVKFAVF